MKLARFFGSIVSFFSRMLGRARAIPATRSIIPAPATPGNLSPDTGSRLHPPPLTRALRGSTRLLRVGSSVYFRERRGTLWRVVGHSAAGANLVLVGRRRERVAELESGRVIP
jgi:hypothetical protein